MACLLFVTVSLFFPFQSTGDEQACRNYTSRPYTGSLALDNRFLLQLRVPHYVVKSVHLHNEMLAL